MQESRLARREGLAFLWAGRQGGMFPGSSEGMGGVDPGIGGVTSRSWRRKPRKWGWIPGTGGCTPWDVRVDSSRWGRVDLRSRQGDPGSCRVDHTCWWVVHWTPRAGGGQLRQVQGPRGCRPAGWHGGQRQALGPPRGKPFISVGGSSFTPGGLARKLSRAGAPPH